MFKLVIQDDEGKTTVVPLMREELTIGRKEGNTIRLTERNVSRAHAKVYRTNGSISIEDLDSYNGIRVNGARIQGRVQLKESDRVQIGDYLIEVQSDARPGQPKSPQDSIQTATIPVMETAPTERMKAQPEPAIEAEPEPTSVDAKPAADTIQTPAIAKEANARLVVLSKNFAGEEFDLMKPAMMIGRTDDNDIWLNHRSISRHHAQIVRENGRYSVVDMQSANGVRVNGEEYGKVELRRGDLIDLGHVRMRFVEPGEDFLFGRDAQAVDIQPRGGNRFAVWLILIALVVIGGVSYLAMQPPDAPTVASGDGDGPEPGDEVVPEVLPPAVDAAVAVVPTPEEDAAVVAVVPVVDAAVVTPPPDPGPALDDLRSQARTALQARNWSLAQRTAETILGKVAGDAEATELLAAAKQEAEMQGVLAKIESCTDDPCIAAQWARMKATSVYQSKAKEIYDAATERYLVFAQAQVDQRIKSTKTQADCTRSLDRLGKEVGVSWPEAQKLVQASRKQCAAKEAAVVVTPPPDNPPPDNPPPDNPPPDTSVDVDELIGRAKAAGKAQQYGNAFKLCRQVLNVKPGHQDALMVCSMAACRLKKEDLAKGFLGQIESTGQRSGIRQFCLKEGVNVD